MSELKAGVIRTPHNEGLSFDGGSDAISVEEGETEFYLKSEVDKTIAEQEETYRNEVEQLLMEIVELKTQVHDYAQGLYVIKARLEKFSDELRRQKYKRCLIIISNIKAAIDNVFFVSGEHLDWLNKWYERWLKIAEQFKEAKCR